MHLLGRDSSYAGWGTIMLSSQLDMTGSRNSEMVLDMMGNLFLPEHQECVISYVRSNSTAAPPALSISVAMAYRSLWHLSPHNMLHTC